MSTGLATFLEEFVVPLLGGGQVALSGPVRPVEYQRMLREAGELGSTELKFLRTRRASELVAVPELPDPDLDELSLWVGLHNLLVFDHPERDRVWARAVAWSRLEEATRAQLMLPRAASVGEGHARHVAIDSLLGLTRPDTVVPTPRGEVRLQGQALPRRRLGSLPRAGLREEVVRWLDQTHAQETQTLVSEMMRASPLSCLLHPTLAPEDWSPLDAPGYLQHRGYARAVCHAWAREGDWVSVGARVTVGLLAGAARATDPQAVGAVVSALIHVHFLRVLELEARLGVGLGSREPGVSAFLAIPLLLSRHLVDFWQRPRSPSPTLIR